MYAEATSTPLEATGINGETASEAGRNQITFKKFNQFKRFDKTYSYVILPVYNWTNYTPFFGFHKLKVYLR